MPKSGANPETKPPDDKNKGNIFGYFNDSSSSDDDWNNGCLTFVDSESTESNTDAKEKKETTAKTVSKHKDYPLKGSESSENDNDKTPKQVIAKKTTKSVGPLKRSESVDSNSYNNKATKSSVKLNKSKDSSVPSHPRKDSTSKVTESNTTQNNFDRKGGIAINNSSQVKDSNTFNKTSKNDNETKYSKVLNLLLRSDSCCSSCKMKAGIKKVSGKCIVKPADQLEDSEPIASSGKNEKESDRSSTSVNQLKDLESSGSTGRNKTSKKDDARKSHIPANQLKISESASNNAKKSKGKENDGNQNKNLKNYSKSTKVSDGQTKKELNLFKKSEPSHSKVDINGSKRQMQNNHDFKSFYQPYDSSDNDEINRNIRKFDKLRYVASESDTDVYNTKKNNTTECDKYKLEYISSDSEFDTKKKTK